MTAKEPSRTAAVRQQADGGWGGPAVAAAFQQGVDQSSHAGGDGDRAGDVEARPAGAAAFGDQPGNGEQAGQGDGDVDEKHPPPGRGLGDHAAGQHPGGEPEPGQRPPHAQRLGPLRPGREQAGDQGQRGRGGQRRAGALQGAGADEHALGGGQPIQQGRHAEDGGADQEHPSAAGQVGGPPAEQDQPAEHQHVGVDHPGQRRLGEPEAGLDRGQGDVDHGLIEKDHELGDGQHGQGEPPAPGCRVLPNCWWAGWAQRAPGAGGSHGVSLTWTRFCDVWEPAGPAVPAVRGSCPGHRPVRGRDMAGTLVPRQSRACGPESGLGGCRWVGWAGQVTSRRSTTCEAMASSTAV